MYRTLERQETEVGGRRSEDRDQCCLLDKLRPHYVMKSTGDIQSDLSEQKNISYAQLFH